MTPTRPFLHTDMSASAAAEGVAKARTGAEAPLELVRQPRDCQHVRFPPKFRSPKTKLLLRFTVLNGRPIVPLCGVTQWTIVWARVCSVSQAPETVDSGACVDLAGGATPVAVAVDDSTGSWMPQLAVQIEAFDQDAVTPGRVNITIIEWRCTIRASQQRRPTLLA